MAVDWTKDIEMIGLSADDIIFEVDEISEEDSFVSINMCYAGNTEHTVHADFYDTICVDYHTGKPLNYFIDENVFTVINVENE